ncbi:MAG: XdhC family protein [Alphaproteobacteria bacterium]
MKRALLDRLREAQAAKTPAVLIRDLATAEACLYIGDTVIGDLDAGDVGETVTAVLASDKGRTETIDDRALFFQPFNPPKRLLLIGAVHIAQFLAPMARMAEYEVTLIDPRTAWATEERFPEITIDDRWPDEALEALKPDSRTAVVALTHDPKIDEPGLETALASPAFYVGALGSKKTHARRVERLTESGVDVAAIARIDAPIGLDIGAVSPAEIAVSILGSMTLALHGPKRKAA